MKLDQTVQLKIAHSLKSEPKNRLIQGGGDQLPTAPPPRHEITGLKYPQSLS
jgi:hypothetical protein